MRYFAVIYLIPLLSLAQTDTLTTDQSAELRTLYAVTATTPLNAYVAGENCTILATRDGGKTWNLVHQAKGPASDLYGIAFADKLNGVAVGKDGIIMRTSDGGSSWSQVRSGSIQSLV